MIASLKASVLYVVADAAASDRTARFIRPAKLPGVEALQATFVRHRYAPHIHDTWTIAHVISGAARFQLEGRWQTAPAGTSFLIAPGAVHTGESASPAGYTYRLLYLEPERLSERGEREFAPRRRCTPVLVRSDELAQVLMSMHGVLAMPEMASSKVRSWRAYRASFSG